MPKNIFLDLDGTLLDSRIRLHTLFSRLVREAVHDPAVPGFDEYWRIKRANVRQGQLLVERFGFTPEMVEAFKQKWMKHVEDLDLLALDRPFPGVDGLLRRLSRDNALYVVTGRQHPERAKAQMISLGWADCFRSVLVTRQSWEKAALIRDNVTHIAPQDVFVGDTGEDVLAAKSLGVGSFAVLSGFLGLEALQGYMPDYIVDTVHDVFPEYKEVG